MQNVIVSFAGIVLCLLFVIFITYFIFFYRKKQLQNEEEKNQLQLKYNQALLESQLEIQEQLLQHVSGEVHDNLGQLAALIKLNLHTLPKEVSPEANDKLEQTRELIKKLVAGLKALSMSLNTDYLSEEGLFKVLEVEAGKLQRTGTLRVHFVATGGPVQLERGKEIFLYRMVQEILANVVKHAEATELTLVVDANEKELTIQVTDNGKGFDARSVGARLAPTSTGLRSLHKRAALVGAILTIDSVISLGTSVKIYVPLLEPDEFKHQNSVG